MRVLQIVHGYPPRENAGTETYAHRVAGGLVEAGHGVHAVAIGPDPTRRQGTCVETPGLTRVVQNAPWAALWNAASDAGVDAAVEARIRSFRPDVVHVQHLAFGSTTWRSAAPIVWTLHDAWAWCAADGRLLRDGTPCPGPGPACAACAAGVSRDGPGMARAVRAAGSLERWVDPERMHAAWRRLPGRLRAALLTAPASPLSPAHIDARNRAFRTFGKRCATVISPSRWLAEAARAQGLRVDAVLPHGTDLPPGPADPPAFLFLGTLAAHKGPDLVRTAWQLAATGVPLRIHGPPGPDPRWSVPNDGPLPHDSVPSALRGAVALVLGSRWPENAPLVILEARAAGCPVIAPRIGGIPEIVEDGVDGWLYPPGDAEALADRLRRAAAVRLVPRPPPTFPEHMETLVALYEAAIGAHNGRVRKGSHE